MRNFLLFVPTFIVCFVFISCNSWINGGSTSHTHWYGEEKGCVEFKNVHYTDSHSKNYSDKDTAGVIYFEDYGKKFRAETHSNGVLISAVILDYNKNKCISIDYQNGTYKETTYKSNEFIYWANVFEYANDFYTEAAETLATQLCIVKARNFRYNGQNVYEKISGWQDIKFSYIYKIDNSPYTGYEAISFSVNLPTGIFDIPTGFVKQ
jgi:hypothetical protein